LTTLLFKDSYSSRKPIAVFKGSIFFPRQV
jgi:hypothetical protein